MGTNPCAASGQSDNHKFVPPLGNQFIINRFADCAHATAPDSSTPADEWLSKNSRVRQVGTPATDLTASLQKAKETRLVPTVPPISPDPPSVTGINHSSAIH